MIETVNLKMILSVALFSALAYLIGRFVIFIVREIVQRSHIVWHKKWLSHIETLLAPIIFIGAIISLMCYNPIWTLGISAVFFFFFKDYLRNYYLGLYFKVNEHFDKDTNITVDNYSGNIEKFGVLGLWLHTESGLQFVNYKRFFSNGFTVNDSDHISTSYTINITYENDQQFRKFKALILSSPYLDNHQKVSITHNDSQITTKVHLRNSNHYDEIINLINENGFIQTK